MIESQIFRPRQQQQQQQGLWLRTLADPTVPPTPEDTDGTLEPSAFDDNATSDAGEGSNDASKGFGWFTLIIFIVILGFVLWRLWIRFQNHQEQRRMDYRSAQADKVLGDMQMVPQHDDFDNELL